MHKIDKLDIEIINMLIDNGRVSCADIANKLGDITERTVRYRLERLVNDGLIKIKAITNPIAVGYTVIADVFIEAEPGMISEVANTLVKFDCVSYVACSTGDRDVSIQIVARNNAEAYSFVTEVIGKVPGVRKTTTSIVPVILKDVYDWHIPKSTV
jgi:Lrp/AsnC family transcriptional regulator for asnA, asnC and gidA